jgi:hypothetical protein
VKKVFVIVKGLFVGFGVVIGCIYFNADRAEVVVVCGEKVFFVCVEIFLEDFCGMIVVEGIFIVCGGVFLYVVFVVFFCIYTLFISILIEDKAFAKNKQLPS